METLVELLEMLKERKKLWLTPFLLVLLLFAGILVLAQGSVLAPFIYSIF